MRYCVELEPMLLPKEQGLTAIIFEDLKKAFHDSFVDLYQQILEFQLRSVLQFFQSRLRNLGRDLIQYEDWDSMLSKIQYLEKTLDKDFGKKNDSVLRQGLEKPNESLYQSPSNSFKFRKKDHTSRKEDCMTYGTSFLPFSLLDYPLTPI